MTPRETLSNSKVIVVKLGTQVLSDKERRIDPVFVASIAKQVATLRERGIRVTIVSSGAVGAGLQELKLEKRPTDLAALQAVAAVGQRRLMDVWAGAFAAFDMPVAQILLTRDDIDHRTRFLNLRNTIAAVHELNGVPIINENDTVSTDELIQITFGDNDILAGMVANALRADLLVLLSVVDGVLDAAGKSVRLVENLDDARELIRTEKSALGKGGMNSKFEAARMMLTAGESLVVANGRDENVLLRLIGGEEVGTLFVPSQSKRNSRSRWIGSARVAGTVKLDDGAVAAIVQRNKSLLPAGITSVGGEFVRGDVIGLLDSTGRQIARGLTNYANDDLQLIAGKKSVEVRRLLPDRSYDEVIHRDNLVVG